MTTKTTELVRQLRQARKSKRLTLAQVAARCLVSGEKPKSDKTINAYEVGRRVPSLEALQQWARALDLRLVCYVEHNLDNVELIECTQEVAPLLRKIADASPSDQALVRDIVARML